MKKIFTTRNMVLMSLLIAFHVLLTGPLAISLPIMRLTLNFIPAIILGALFGPIGAGVSLMLADLINFTLFVNAPFFIGFTIMNTISGVLFGFFFYKKTITLSRAIVSGLTISTLEILILVPINLMLLLGVEFWAILPARIVQWAVFTTLQILITYFVMPRITNLSQFKQYVNAQVE